MNEKYYVSLQIQKYNILSIRVEYYNLIYSKIINMRNLNMNNIKCLLALYLVLLGLNTIAQTEVIENPNIPKIENSISEYVSVDTILSFTNEVAVNRSLKSCKWENEIVFTNFNTNKNSDTIVIYRINIVDANVDTFYVYEKRIRERMKSVYSSSFDAIAYNGSKIVLNLYDELYVYELDSNNKLNKIGKHTVAEDFREMAFLNDSVLPAFAGMSKSAGTMV